MNHLTRFLALQSTLGSHQALWRPSPFHERRPDWCAQWPALADAVCAIDEPGLEQLGADPAALLAWLAPELPVAATLSRLCDLPTLASRTIAPCDAHFDCAIPGRKRQQIDAFVAHAPKAEAPLLEWCAGKGHLGRRLALADHMPVTSLELDPALCEATTQLAARVGVDQKALCADATDAEARARVRGHEVVALHACGELHRVLVRDAAQAGAHAYRIAPCCYDRGSTGAYRPLSRYAALPLDAATLRLAVTETVTARHHRREDLARDQAWKLGFIALRNQLEGEARRSFLPVPAHWRTGDFPAFCRTLAERERVNLPAGIDWTHWLAVGERRRAEVRRFELVRHAFRRPLEMWLVMDLALGLEDAGFEVQVGSFCARALTPRNLMVLAKRGRDALRRA